MRKQWESARVPRQAGSLILCLLMLLGSLLAGCIENYGVPLFSDDRLSLKEFLEMQQETEAASVPSSQPAAAQEEARALLSREMGPYKVGQGDVLNVTISEVTSMVSGTPVVPLRTRVDRNGTINLPVVGDLKVDNMELEDIEDLINEAYVPKVYKEASVFVSIASVESTEVIVKGAVTNPGLIPLRRTERNVLFALVSAGGLTEAASGIITLQRLRLAGSLATLNMSTPEGIKQALMEEPLEDGDIINVHGWDMPDIIVSGLIKLSGNATMSRITLPPGKRCKSVLQVLAEAGGLPSTLFIREGTLTRWYPDGRNVRVRLDLLRLVSGKDPNFMLQAGDILWVNHTFDTWVQQWFNSHVMLNAGASANMSYNATATDQLNHRDTATGAGTPTSGFDPFGFLQRGFLLNQPTTP